MTFRPLIHGLTAGAVGTTVLNTVTYLDMVVRDRPSSDVPAETAERATDLAGYGVGAAYGVLRSSVLSGVPRPIAGVGIAAAATAATVLPYSALGVSDPRSWPAKSWAADIIPHLCYGWATAAAFDALHSASAGD